MDSYIDFTKLEGFEWDKGNLEHIKSHSVNYKECEEVFLNKPILISQDKSHSDNEDRFQVLGLTNNRRLIFLVFMIRKNKIRIVSARDQNKKENKKIQQAGGENL